MNDNEWVGNDNEGMKEWVVNDNEIINEWVVNDNEWENQNDCLEREPVCGGVVVLTPPIRNYFQSLIVRAIGRTPGTREQGIEA
jgi:hypothetical protein